MVSVPLMRCSSEAVAIMLPESFISSRADNKCNFLKEVLGGLVWGSFSYATAGSNTQFWRRNSEESQVAAAAIISDFF